jgi:hypothetical protein
MSSGRPALADWRQALRQADDCPYVGLRSQTGKDAPWMLVGRSQDLERITRAVLDRPLVVLDGYSGVGKSSLLKNGLYHRLNEAGFAVLVSGRWPKLPDGFDGTSTSIEMYVAKAIQMTQGDPSMPSVPAGVNLNALIDNGGLCMALDQEYEETGSVLILDQFEELLREQSNVASRVVEWIISVGYRYNTRIVISLRTDSLHLLDPLLRGVRPFSMDRVRVEEIADRDSIDRVIRTTKRPSELGSVITDPAVECLMKLWDSSRPKLLALQATLYALYFRAQSRRKESATAASTIDAADASTLAVEADARGVDPFTFGLRDSIRLKIEHAEAACRSHRLDEYLICGTREIIRRVAPLLSSGTSGSDFKIPVHEFDLAQRALTRELGVLERAVTDELQRVPHHTLGITADGAVATLFAALREADDFLEAPLEDIASLRGFTTCVARPKEISESGGSHRRVDVPAGPMMGSTAIATLVEELRRVAFAIEWLESTEIVRKDPEGTLLLVHDGSGAALRAWAKTQAMGPTEALRQLTGARGEHYVWPHAEIGGDNCKVIANLNWRDCRISARFHNVIFVNCDFSGSRFDSCTFEGTNFVNCLLDDANFEYCEIRGAAELPTVMRPREEGRQASRVGPSFTVESSREEVGFFSPYPPYLEVAEGQRAQFFSDTSGKAAVPGPPSSHHLGEVIAHFVTAEEGEHGSKAPIGLPVDVTPAAGGIAMVGGRVCLLTLYRCKSVNGGSVAFHHVSGDGLEIVEQDGGGIDIHGAAIRGLSISRDQDNVSGMGAVRRAGSIDLRVNESILVNVYFSDELAGTAKLEHSVVLMLINASENSNEAFQVHIRDCRYQFLVNTSEPAQSTEDSQDLHEEVRYFDPVEGSHSRFQARNRSALAGDLEVMDYRYRPDMWEELQRQRRALVRSRGGRGSQQSRS